MKDLENDHSMSGSPGIYLDDLSRSEENDRHYAVLGRALFLATRFENDCHALAKILGGAVALRAFEPGVDPVNLIAGIAASVDANVLNQVILKMAGKKGGGYLADTLHAAREARNSVAHDLASGFDFAISTPHIDRVYGRVSKAVAALAEADKLLSFVISRTTNEDVLAGEAEKNYIRDVSTWVTTILPSDWNYLTSQEDTDGSDDPAGRSMPPTD